MTASNSDDATGRFLATDEGCDAVHLHDETDLDAAIEAFAVRDRIDQELALSERFRATPLGKDAFDLWDDVDLEAEIARFGAEEAARGGSSRTDADDVGRADPKSPLARQVSELSETVRVGSKGPAGRDASEAAMSLDRSGGRG